MVFFKLTPLIWGMCFLGPHRTGIAGVVTNQQFILASSQNAGDGGTFHFDNVILEEGSFNSTQVTANRSRITTSVAFGDHLGRTHQTQTRTASAKFLATSTAFDEFARPESTFLPVSVNAANGNPTFASGHLGLANTLYNGSGGMANAGGYPYSEVQYAQEPGGRALAQGAPGASFRLGSTHETKQGFFFNVSFSTAGLPANLENPATNAVACNYRVDWVRDADSNFTITWTNHLGQVLQVAQNLTRGGASAASWTYSVKQYDYYPDGRLKQVRTPLDVQAGNLKFAEVTEYNSLGQVISTYTKNSGLTRYWYNRRGDLRFSQDSGQKESGEYSYREYDTQGRLISQGVHILSTMNQGIADHDVYTGGTKREGVGYIYDDYDAIAGRIGFSLDAILPYHDYLDKRFAKGRLICQYNRNLDGWQRGSTALENMVADFYAYSEEGNQIMHLKAVHPIRHPTKKFQDAYFTYDAMNRLVESVNYLDASSGTLSTRHLYEYDALGRLSAVKGLSDKQLAAFTFHDWGPLKQVILGGNGSGTQGTKVEYFYHIQGWVREIKCTNLSTGKVTFQEFLGYEGKSNAASQVPNPLKPRFSGQIAQRLYSLGRDINSQQPVRLVNYDYDALGRMVASDFQKNSNADPYNTDETINFAAPLSWNTTSNENDSYLTYDLNGRITLQRNQNIPANQAAQYSYQDGTYKLDHVFGTLNPSVSRPMQADGTFQYDARGRLTWDNSKQLSILYGWDNMPVATLTYSTMTQMAFDYYDAAGQRVSRFFDDGTGFSSTHYLNLGVGNSKEWREVYNSSDEITSTSETVNLFANAQLGRIRPDGTYEFYLKNHQGSTMKTVTDAGASSNNTYDYTAYGDLRKLKEVGATVTHKFTGKEYEGALRAYYFGARWYDPELGIWLTSDPAGQFFNPYSFVGGDPTNMTDPDGRIAIWDDLVVGIVGGVVGYVGGGLYNGDWLNWTALYNVYNGASSAVVGWNVGVVTTAATGGCFVCGYAAGSLAGSSVSSLNNAIAYGVSGGGIGTTNATLGVGPASYTFGNGQGTGFNFATPDKWGSAADVFNSSMTLVSYAGAAGSVYGTYGSYTRGSLGFQNPFNQSTPWSLVGSDGATLKNFNLQSQASYNAAILDVKEAYSSFKERSGFDVRLELNASDLKMTNTVKNHLDRPYYNSVLTIDEIMKAKFPIPDPGGVPGGLRWDVPGAFNSSNGTWQLVVDPATKRILHYNFVTLKK